MGLTFAALRKLVHEQDVGATVTHGSAATTSGDIAQYPWPLGVPRIAPPGSKKRKRKGKSLHEAISADRDANPFPSVQDYVNTIIRQVAISIRDELAEYGIKVTITDTHDELTVSSPLKNEYRLYFNGYDLIFAPKHVKIYSPKQLDGEEVQGEDEAFLTWEMPVQDDVALLWGVIEKVEIISYEVSSMVIGLETMLETPPFVDLSIQTPLSQKELARVKKHFRIIPSDQYSGSINTLDYYRSKHGKKKDESGAVIKEAVDKLVHRPYNDWKKTFFFRDADKFRERLLSYKWKGHKPKEKIGVIIWNDQIRYHFTTSSTDYVEALTPDKNGKMTWCCIHAVRKLPAGYDDYYFKELTDYLDKYSPPTKFKAKEWNFPEFIRKLWDVHADEITYIGGIAYHKDGRWGIDFQVSAAGRGLPDNSDNQALIVQYYFQVEESTGLVFACVDPTPSRTPADRHATVADFIWRIYPSFNTDYFVAMLKKYTDST